MLNLDIRAVVPDSCDRGVRTDNAGNGPTQDLEQIRTVDHYQRAVPASELLGVRTRQPATRAVADTGLGLDQRMRADRAHRAVAREHLTAVGASDPPSQAPIFVAFLDGVVFDHLAGASERRPTHDELRETFLNLLHSFTTPPHP
ncbi:hypothetical protein [Actinomadura meridiana]|uniref:hypothetical protein n=1 Tax=Actinomadura meridiana TaxID=559626 RepID=UPI003CD07FB9